MATAPVRRCYYCGGQLTSWDSNMLTEADSHGNYGYCPDSPSRAHRTTSYGQKAVLRSCPPVIDEAELRRFRRELADSRYGILPPEAKRQWRWGTCDRCHTETLVIGPDVQPLCVYCDELRILPPLPPARQRPEKTLAQPAPSPVQRRRSERRSIGIFCILGLIMLAIPTETAQTLAACLFGLAVIYGISSW